MVYEAVVIRSYEDYIDANLAVSFLESEGVDSWLRDEKITTILPLFGQMGGGIKLIVQERNTDIAINLLQAEENRQKKLMQCPVCQINDVSYIAAAKPKNWFTALISFSIAGYPVSIEKSYHCFACGHEFKYLE